MHNSILTKKTVDHTSNHVLKTVAENDKTLNQVSAADDKLIRLIPGTNTEIN